MIGMLQRLGVRAPILLIGGILVKLLQGSGASILAVIGGSLAGLLLV